MNSIAGLFQFMKNGPGKMTVWGIERKCKCHISITEEKGTVDKAEDTEEPVLITRMMAQDIETDT